MREITGGEGVAVVYDGVGKDTFMGSLDSLRVRALTPDRLSQFAFNPRLFKNMNSPEEYEEAKRILGL